MISLIDIEKVYKRIQSDISVTPLIHAPRLSEISGANVYLKLEHQQKTGSFKIRGMLSKLYSLNKNNFNTPLVAASTGNHAAAFVFASKHFDFKGVLFMPESTNTVKVEALKSTNVDIIFHGKNSVEAEAAATAYANKTNSVLIHPYNDLKVITGQATLGLNIHKQLPEVDTIFAPVGGGGLASGLCLYAKAFKNIKVIGCQPENASEMYASIKANSIVPPSSEHTIADASAGGIEKGAITFDICKKHLSGIEIIPEEAIKKAVAFLVKYHQITVEPTAALPVAALLDNKQYEGQNIVLILTGKKINTKLLKEIISSYGNSY